MTDTIQIKNVSKFYGEVLGINRVTLTLEPGITGLVGPNGSGKTTLMNLLCGLLRPTEGSISILGIDPDHPEALFDKVGYSTQFDSFPDTVTGYEFLYGYLRVHGFTHRRADELTWKSLERVNLQDAAKRRVEGYSKGMRQRVRLAQAIAHEPRVLVLDEPLNGLDPMARAEVIEVFQHLAQDGCHLIVSSHILHEVDMISDRVVLLSSGYVVAEGEIEGVRTEVQDQPIQILVRCDKPGIVASRLFAADQLVVEATLHEDGLLARTRDANRFYEEMNRIVLQDEVTIETIAVADSDVRAVYQYLIGAEGDAR